MTDTVTVNCADVELDNGENLRALSVNDHLDLDRPAAGLSAGTWQLLAYEGEHDERVVLRRLTAEEIQAARGREAFARIYE